ncbi:hypothetical protein SEUCBS139899_000693 [Sporothrix eucalyptigena]
MSEKNKQAVTTDEPENLKARIKASYDAIAPAYNAWTVDHSPKRLKYLQQLIEQLKEEAAAESDPAPLRILELGAGAGRPVTEKLLVDLPAAHITANDISTAQLNLAREALGEHGEKVASSPKSTVDWVEGDMMALEFPEGSLDAVLGFYSIIHLPQNEQITILERIGRWLKPGKGRLLANFAGEPMPGMILEKWLKQEEGWMYWSGLGTAKTEATLQGAGLHLDVSKIEIDDVDVQFHWVIASRPAKK